ncbi:MAG: type II secretion system minor pseudopilin GspK [Pseudomonadota bacterium]
MKTRRQRGVAVITALLLTTLAVTIVASLFWQQQVQVRSMENQRLHLQTKWILRGALDWARLVLRQDGSDSRDFTTLSAVWNTPLAETRLDQYIERERVEGEVFDATLSGRIIDATSRYNLMNLAVSGKAVPGHVEIYKRLLQNLQLDPGLAQRTADAFAASQVPVQAGSAAGQPAEFTALNDLLAIPGYTPETIARLHDFAIVLPKPTPVNANTAAPEVLAALMENYSVSQANALAARRKQAYFTSKDGFKAQVFGPAPKLDDSYDVKSEYFLVLSRVRLDRAALDSEALVSRPLNPLDATLVWIRQN